jgi:hypothetical protein
MESVRRRPAHVAENALYPREVAFARIVHMHACLLHGVRDVGPSDGEVL